MSSFHFKAEFTGGICDGCDELIKKGDLICYSNGKPVHVEHQDVVPPIAHLETTVRWANTIAPETAQRVALMELEEEQVAPLQRPICQGCFLELPVSMICGTCGE